MGPGDERYQSRHRGELCQNIPAEYVQLRYDGGGTAKDIIENIFKHCGGKSATVNTDIERRVFHIEAENFSEEVSFSIADFDHTLVTAGGWVEHADLKY